ncbi:transcriptional regulator [bacterium]|jgi:nitrogen regulatory protein PII|nr:transcriptional regulator [bacterium]
MKKMKKIELVIESLYLNKLIELFDKKGISGYTIIKDIEGKGEHGIKSADEVTDVFKNNYVFTVCDEEKLMNIVEDIRSFIKRNGGRCIVSDVSWVL